MISPIHYFLFIIFFFFFLCCLVFFLSYFFSFKKYSFEKSSTYECGFNPFTDARKKIDIRFYLVAILFIIFDLELAYFFPWALDFSFLSYEGFFTMLIFFFILVLGFILEALKGALEWE